jgi:glucose/arabinose dehydrogenase
MKRVLFWCLAFGVLGAAPLLAYTPNADDIKVPAGYKIEMFATGLNEPMGVTFGKGEVFALESGWQSPTNTAGGHQVTAIQVYNMSGKHLRTLAKGKLDHQASLGVTYHEGALYVSGTNTIWKVDPASGAVSEWVKDLPTLGDHNVSKVQFKGEYVYFGLGSDTNSGVVGLDVAGPFLAKTKDPNTGELARDVPCKDIVLSGVSYATEDGKVHTSPYRPYGVTAKKGDVIKGQVPCNSSVLRAKIADPQHTMELLDWGFRNPFGLAFAPANHPVLKGALLVANNGMDTRGSRPVTNSPDELHIAYGQGDFHGWPDSTGFLHVAWKQASVDVTGMVLGDNARGIDMVYDHLPMTVAEPIALFPVNSSADGMDFSTSAKFGDQGDLFVALWGQIGFAPVDRQESASNVVKVHFRQPAGVQIEPFAENKVPGPADRTGKGGLSHPIEARFGSDGSALYVTDFGPVDVRAFRPTDGAGTVWKISKK